VKGHLAQRLPNRTIVEEVLLFLWKSIASAVQLLLLRHQRPHCIGRRQALAEQQCKLMLLDLV
jgi:hypothetical protein